MEATKTAPSNWKEKPLEFAAVDANMSRIPLGFGNAFTFTTIRPMTSRDYDVVIQTPRSWQSSMTDHEPPPVIEPEEPYALNAR
ncbi:MAG TPA: hypothetical protein VKA15_26840 [Isosphaeraceae bacterium]|nr:hypothetical protein [Isosphaeraceae bacterium]